MKKQQQTWESMMNKKIGECLGIPEQNGVRLLCAKWNMTPSNVLTVALSNLFKHELDRETRTYLEDTGGINRRVGETINARLGVFGYDPEVNDIPNDKRWLIDDSYVKDIEV